MADTNPYAIPGSTNTGLISNAQGVTGYDASKATAQTAATTNATAAQATNNSAALTNWTVDPNQTVQGQLDGIIAKNSPLMQRAETKANEQMNGRGLLNSSMAVGAAQTAVLDAATPIATADAGTYADAAKTNAGAANTNSQFNATQANQTSQFNASAATDVSKTNANAANTQAQFNANAQNSASQFNATADNAAKNFTAGAANTASLQKSETDAAAARQAVDVANQRAMQEYDAASKLTLQTANAKDQQALAALDQANKVALANIEATYKNQMQTSQSMAASYQSMVESMTKIMQDPDLDAAGKQKAIDNITTLYNNALAMQSNVSGLNLGSLLSPTQVGGTGSPTAVPASSSGSGKASIPTPVYAGGNRGSSGNSNTSDGL